MADDRCWEIVTPEYNTPQHIAFGVDMPTWGCDVVYVMAPTRDKAKVEGVRALRRLYPGDWIADAGNPFAGLKVHLAPNCEHLPDGQGHVVNDGKGYSFEEDCPACAAEYAAEMEASPF